MNKDCLVKLQRVLTPEEYDKLETAFNNGDGATWGDIVETKHESLTRAKKQSITELKARRDLLDYTGKKLKEGMDPDQVLRNLVSNTWKTGDAGIVSVERKIFGYSQRFKSMLADAFHASRPKFLGLARSRDGEYAQNLVKNILRDSDATVGKGADKAADAWKTVKTEIDNTLAKLTGNPKEINFNGLPLTHRQDLISKVPVQKWKNEVKELMVVDPMKVSNLSEDELLEKVYQHYATDGSHTLDMSDFNMQDYSGAQLSKLLMPKNGEAWLTYAKMYGKHVSPLDAMEEYIDNAATRIGLIKTFGLNPKETFDRLTDIVRRKTGKGSVGKGAKNTLDYITAHERGSDGMFSQVLKGVRDFQTIEKLGAAPITALSDPVFSSLEAMYRGGNAFKFIRRYVATLAPGGTQNKLLAARMALIGEYAMDRVSVVNRYSETGGFGYLARAADFATRASGLNHMTNSGKAAFSLEMSSLVASWKGKPLNPKAMRMFKQFGITEDMWSEIQKGVVNIRGVDFVDATKIPDVDVAAKFIGMINESCSVAIPEPNAQVRSIAAGGAPANTPAAEIMKTLTQFHSFGISTMLTHVGRALDGSVPGIVRMKYAAATLLGTTAVGAGILQLKDIAIGKTPRSAEGPEFWRDAMLQGGALGVLGDLLFNDPDLFGGTAFYVIGPTVGDLVRLQKAIMGDVKDYQEASAEFVDIMKGYGGASVERLTQFPARLWYIRLAFQRNLMDQMNRWTDNNYDRKREREYNRMQNQDQEYWWQPGERLPDFAQ